MPSLPQINGWQWTFNRVTGKWSLTQTTGSMHALISRLTGDGSITNSAMMRSRTPSDASSWYNPVSPADSTPWVDSPSIPTSIDTARSLADSYRSELRNDTASPISSYGDEYEQHHYREEMDTSSLAKKQQRPGHSNQLQPKPLSFNKSSNVKSTSDQSSIDRPAKRFSFESSRDQMAYDYDQPQEYVQISWRNKNPAQATQSAYDDQPSSNKLDDHDVSPLTAQNNSSLPTFRDPVWNPSERTATQSHEPTHSHNEPYSQTAQPSFSFPPAFDDSQPRQPFAPQMNRPAQSTERPMSAHFQSLAVPSQTKNIRPVSQIITSTNTEPMHNAPGTQPANMPAPQPYNMPTVQSYNMPAQHPQNMSTQHTHNVQAQQPHMPTQQPHNMQPQQSHNMQPHLSQPPQMQPQAQAQPQNIAPTIPQGYCLVPMQHVQNNGMPAAMPQTLMQPANNGQASNGQHGAGNGPTFYPPPVSHNKEKSPFLVIDANSKAELKAMGKSISSWTSKTTKSASKWLDGK